MVSWSPPLLLLLMLVWLWLYLIPNLCHGYPTKMAGSNFSVRSNPKLSAFSCPLPFPLSEMSRLKLDARNSFKSGQLCVPATVVVCHYCEYHYSDSFGSHTHDIQRLPAPLSPSQRCAIWFKFGSVYRTFIRLIAWFKNVSMCQEHVVWPNVYFCYFSFCVEIVISHGL